MKPNLEPTTRPKIAAQYQAAFDAWQTHASGAGRLKRDASTDVYAHMWSALSAWATSLSIPLGKLTDMDLQAYLASRGGKDSLSNRYAARLIRLIDWVLEHHCETEGIPPHTAVPNFLRHHPEIRYAGSRATDQLPEYLNANQAKRLVTYLSAVRPGRPEAGSLWSDVRNRAGVGLMLGAGLTPGEFRALTLNQLFIDGGRTEGVPWKVRIPGHGKSPAREAPIAAWAGQLLRFWLDLRLQLAIPGVLVFPSTRSTGKPWGKVAQYTATQKVLTAAGVDAEEGGSFKLRHTFALRQLKKGRAPNEVARWLGVSDPAVMARYLRVVDAPIDID